MLHHQLRISRHVLSFSLLALHFLVFICFILCHSILLQLEGLISFGQKIVLIYSHKRIVILACITGCLNTVLQLFRISPVLNFQLCLSRPFLAW